MTTVSVLIPAYNEAERIASTIRAIQTINGITEIVVVDDGSTDGTAQIAEQAGATTVFVKENGGKGSALNIAAKLAIGDILLLLDADLGDTATEAACLLPPVTSGQADMSIATFPVIPGKGGGVGLVVRVSRNGISRLTGRVMQAPLSGQRAITRALLTATEGFAEGWGVEVALTVRALWANLRVVEIPTSMSHRVTGRSREAISHRAAQLVAALRTLNNLKQLKSAGKAEPRS